PGIQTKAAEDGNTYAIQATFGVSRLQTTDDSSLQIRDGQTGDLLLQIGGEGDQSFSQWLADYFNYTYGDQEFLDREYNFGIDIKMSDDNAWEWYQIGCSILGWGKRVYNYTLH
ncbi:MAG: FimB/Mfa2 family fimbrial subunit, partial [Muribaculaceae bacterium]|nr:FimB/Mfa2 family fimbrial subunit [Muribaculaceae bacterium]